MYRGKVASLCHPCAVLFDRRSFCLHCEQIYRPRDGDRFDGELWVECIQCSRWSHVCCEEAAGCPGAAKAHAAAERGDETEYKCVECRGETPEPRTLVLPAGPTPSRIKTASASRKRKARPGGTRGRRLAPFVDFSTIFLQAAEEAERRGLAPSSKLATHRGAQTPPKSQSRTQPPAAKRVRRALGPRLSRLAPDQVASLIEKARQSHHYARIVERKQQQAAADKKRRTMAPKVARAAAAAFYAKLSTFLKAGNTTLTRYPTLGGRDVSLLLLFRHVVARGGLDAIADHDKSWDEILERLQPGFRGDRKDARCVLRALYIEYLSAFERRVLPGQVRGAAVAASGVKIAKRQIVAANTTSQTRRV